MKEGHQSAESFFSTELSKKLGREIRVAIMWVDFEDIDVPDPPYHKSVSQAIVEQYFRDWNPIVAGFLVCNIREDGKIALVDGRHRKAMAIRAGKKGWQFIVTHGLKLEEEAQAFRYFTNRKQMTQAENLRSLIIEKDPSALRLRAAVLSRGCCLPFESDKNRHRITAVGALVRMFESGGEDVIKRVLDIVVHAWFGAPITLTSPMLTGVWRFITHDEVKAKLDPETLKAVLASNNPDALIQRGRIVATQERCGVTYGVANIVRVEYNKKARGSRRVEFDFAHAPRKGKRRDLTRPSAGQLPNDLPSVPAEVAEEVDRRLNGNRRVPVSPYLFNVVKAALGDNHSTSQIEEAFGVSTTIIAKASKALFLEQSRTNKLKKKAAKQ